MTLEDPYHVGYELWVVLGVAVEGGDDRRPRRAGASEQGRALAAAFGVAQDAQPGPCYARSGKPLLCVIGRAVINIDDLERRKASAVARDLVEKQFDCWGFVLCRYHKADPRSSCSAG